MWGLYLFLLVLTCTQVLLGWLSHLSVFANACEAPLLLGDHGSTSSDFWQLLGQGSWKLIVAMMLHRLLKVKWPFCCRHILAKKPLHAHGSSGVKAFMIGGTGYHGGYSLPAVKAMAAVELALLEGLPQDRSEWRQASSIKTNKQNSFLHTSRKQLSTARTNLLHLNINSNWAALEIDR